MRRRTNERVAGSALLLYIAAGLTHEAVASRATAGATVADMLASVRAHPFLANASTLLNLAETACAVTLAVTLWAITRDTDSEFAMLGLACRLGEGLMGALPITSLGLVWLATSTAVPGFSVESADAIGRTLIRIGAWKSTMAATLFAAGSASFCVPLRRGRLIPAWLAWLGLVGSVLLLMVLPLQLAGVRVMPVVMAIWGAMFVFELVLAVLLIAKGTESGLSGRLETSDELVT